MEKSIWYTIRKEAGITQKKVAEHFGVKQSYIWALENGVTNMPQKYKDFYLSLKNRKEN